MSLLDTASLIVTPNGYKASKLYSVKPTDASGDMVVSRATTATRVNSSNLIESVAINVPRLDYTLGGCPSILVEPQRTNLVFPSASLTTQTRTVTAVANTLSFYGTGTIVLSGAYTATLTGTGANNRVSLTFTPIAGSLILTVTGTVTNAQLEAGAYATSYIPTVTGTVSRNADVITRNNVYTNNLITSSGGTWFMELRNNLALTRDGLMTGLFLDTSTDSFTNGFLIRNITGNSRLNISKWQSNSGFSLYTTTTDTTKIAIKWNGATADIFANGVKVVIATSFTPTAMQFLKVTSLDGIPYNINQMALFSTPLTDTQCISLTTP
jgi:hypothetical protein